MAEPLINLLGLRTTPPAVPPGFLERPRLDERLTAAASRPLTLVCAGPGHGKTLALASWIRRHPGASMSPGCRWTTPTTTRRRSGRTCSARSPSAVPFRLISPLRDLIPGVRFDVHAPGLISAGLADLPEPVVLVLDDFQAITNSRVLRSFERLLDHQPPQLHIVLATRADPPIRLQRRRVAGELADIRAVDLAFTAGRDRKAPGRQRYSSLRHPTRRVAGPHEGMGGRLRLAMFSVDAADIDDVIDRFTGNDGLVAEYLMEEVLDRVPPAGAPIPLGHQCRGENQPATGQPPDRPSRLSADAGTDWSLRMRSFWSWPANPTGSGSTRCCGSCCCAGSNWSNRKRCRTCICVRPNGSLHMVTRFRPFGTLQRQDWGLVSHLLATIAWPLALTPCGPALAAALEPAMKMAVRSRTVHTRWPPRSATISGMNSDRCVGNATTRKN